MQIVRPATSVYTRVGIRREALYEREVVGHLVGEPAGVGIEAELGKRRRREDLEEAVAGADVGSTGRS